MYGVKSGAQNLEGKIGLRFPSKGVYKGRKPSLTGERVIELRRRAQAGEKKAALAREFGISRETLYSHLARQTV